MQRSESTTDPEPVAEPETVSEPVAEPETVSEPVAEPETVSEPEPVDEGTSHLFAVKTTGGQEKIVMRMLEARIKLDQKDEDDIKKAKEEGKEIEINPAFPRVKNVQSVVLLSDFKGYVVIEAQDPSAMFSAIQGIRHVRGHLRGELTYDDIDKYLIKKSTVSELAVENTVEIIGGPFKGMKATITRLDQEKEEATVVLLDATYQLPVTVDANYLKLVPA